MIPALKEVSGSQIRVGHTLWGWWDGVCNYWHVMPAGQAVVYARPIENAGNGAVDVAAGRSDYVFDDASRLLVS
jgi:hypothetical protein